MKIYKVADGTLNVPVRNGSHRNANIKGRLEEDDKIFSDKEENNYVRIAEVEMPGHGTDLSMKGYWVSKVWLEYRGKREKD